MRDEQRRLVVSIVLFAFLMGATCGRVSTRVIPWGAGSGRSP